MRACVHQSIQLIFDTYKEKVTNQTYYPSLPIETLKSRMTAVWLLQSGYKELVKQAEIFLQKTSTAKIEDLIRLKEFSTKISSWDEFKICSIYENISGPVLEYTLTITNTEKISETIHRHALYCMQDEGCCFVSQTPPLVRVIGDPVLHQPGIPFPSNYTADEYSELMAQIAIAKEILIKTGGGGIAANQCAAIKKPYQFVIVGVFYDIPEHVDGVKKRYPTANFPQAKIMVNTQILASSKASQKFKHGCLSIPSPNRCEINSPEEMIIQYLNPEQNMAIVTVTMKGIDAIALWHEMNHILDGKTYMDTALVSLSPVHLNILEEMVITERKNRMIECHIPELTVPPFYFIVLIDHEGRSQLDEAALHQALTKMTEETLTGLEARCRWHRSIHEKTPSTLNDSGFCLFNKKDDCLLPIYLQSPAKAF